jgi:hypothetical protein
LLQNLEVGGGFVGDAGEAVLARPDGAQMARGRGGCEPGEAQKIPVTLQYRGLCLSNEFPTPSVKPNNDMGSRFPGFPVPLVLYECSLQRWRSQNNAHIRECEEQQ